MSNRMFGKTTEVVNQRRMSSHTGTAMGLLQRQYAYGNHAVGGERAECKKKRETDVLQRAVDPSASQDGNVPPIVHDVLRSSGQPLDAETRVFMEPRFGRDFSGVQVHADSRAAESAQAVNALAYTVGRDVVFGVGQFAPRSPAGRKLMAHELTHVVQQSRGGVSNLATALQVSEPDNADEREAEAVATRVMDASGNDRVETNIHPATTAIQRLGDLTKIPAGLEANCEIASDSPPSPTEDLLFGNAIAAVSPLLQAQIDNFVLNWQAAGANAPVRVDGFASTVGTDESNWRLSCDRALAVASALKSPSPGITGIPAGFIRTVAQGETSEFGAEANNRRATISSPILTAPTPTPAPTPASSCRIDVRATHIGGALSGAPVWHLFIVYTDGAGSEFFYRGGPGGSCPGIAGGYGSIQTTHGAYTSGTVDWDPSAPSVTVLSGASACGKDSCFASQLSRIDSTCTPYSPTGPNSNTVASTLLNQCGAPRNKPVWIAPGWGDPDL